MKKSKMDGKSLNPQEELLELLKQKFPEVFAEGQVDCKKLKQTLGEEVDLDNERYGMAWNGKSNCFKVIQESTTATLKPSKDESVNFNETGNLFIEGDNLEVLKVLQKSYYGQVKMIYIDPPYNTGNDFVYNDDFKQSKDEYQQEAGIKDDNGNLRGDGLMKNTKDRGHYHSDWLNMMYPRLFLARNLLKQDGVIFVSIDDNEVHNLKMIMNEIFGEENFRNSIIIKRGAKSVQMQFDTIDKLGSGYETVLMYSRNANHRYPRLEKEREEVKHGTWNNHWRGSDRPTMRYEIFGINPEKGQWRWSKDRSLEAIKNYDSILKELGKNKNSITQEDIDEWYHKQIAKSDDKIDLLRLSSNKKPEHYVPPSETMLANDVWFDFPANSSNILKRLFGFKVFDNPKPFGLINRCMDFTDKEDIILDFFAGSGTTAHAVMARNSEDGGQRRCISVQLPELCDEKSEAYKAGYKTIADISKERLRLSGKEIVDGRGNQLDLEENKLDIGFKVFKLDKSNFKIWQTNVKNDKELLDQMSIFVDSVKAESTQDNILYELVLKSGLDLNVDVEKKSTDKKTYYSLESGKLVICLEDKISQGLVDTILSEKPEKVICLDKAFGGNDQLKTNTLLQMESAKIDFKII